MLPNARGKPNALTELRFYLDEHLSPDIAEQLKDRGIDTVTVRDLEMLGDSDENHLRRATEMNCVLCTQDTDFLRLNAAGFEHTGIVFMQQFYASIGAWVKVLSALHATTTAEEMRGQLRFLSSKND